MVVNRRLFARGVEPDDDVVRFQADAAVDVRAEREPPATNRTIGSRAQLHVARGDVGAEDVARGRRRRQSILIGPLLEGPEEP